MNLRRGCLTLLLAGLAAGLAGGCATTTTETGRSRFVVPKQVSDAYTEVELRAMLMLVPESACADAECEAAEIFRSQVTQIGQRLARAARELDGAPADMPEFQFLVPAKTEQGTLSSTTGGIVVFDGLRRLELDEPALAFVVAREMGHVLAGHHEENSATSLMISVAATVALPVTAVLRGGYATLSGLMTALTTTSASATVATTAASLAGNRIVKGLYRPDQLREADTLALRLLHRAGWSPMEVADALHFAQPRLGDEGWLGELRLSKARLDSITAGPPWLMPSTIAEASQATRPRAID